MFALRRPPERMFYDATRYRAIQSAHQSHLSLLASDVYTRR